MITKTLNLDSTYESLFDEIRQKSNNAIDIHNVEEFFGNIMEITALDKKYLRLPLDEPLFEIDANSRKITIPDAFRSNGLSVQNDHLAETVFFSIDRYFDYMDLSNTDVTINWKMGNETGKTSNFIMNTEVIPGSIVFGWPVNKAITQKSGSLTFAVEFCKKDNNTDTVLYDFNTLAATITIKDGLVVGNAEVTHLDNDILSILANSQFGEGDAAVGPIQWLTGEGHGLVAGTYNGTSAMLQPYTAEINLNTIVTDGIPESVPANLFAQGFVDNGTEIKYMNAIGSEIIPTMVQVAAVLEEVEDRDNLDTSKVYKDSNGPGAAVVETEDLAEAEHLWWFKPLNENLIYYVQIEDSDPVAYRQASEEELNSWNTADQAILYLKLAKISPDTAGTYIVKAQGEKFAELNEEDEETGQTVRVVKKIGAGATESTDAVVIPAVTTPSNIEITKSAFSIEDEEYQGYSFDEESSEKVVYITDEQAGSLTANAVLDKVGALQYVWQKKTGSDTQFSNVAEGNVPYIALDRLHTDLSSTQAISAEGQYRVLVTHFLNSGYSDQVTSDVFTASKLAGKITGAQVEYRIGNTTMPMPSSNSVDYNSKDTHSLASGSITLTIKAIENEQIEGSKGIISYEWYQQDSRDDVESRVQISNNASITLTSGDAYLTPVIKNNYNGSIFTLELDTIFVDDNPNKRS